MKKNEELIEINGVKPPLHLNSEPGKYVSFVLQLKSTILTKLNTGNTIEVTMPNKNEAERLINDLINQKINEDEKFSLKVEGNILKIYQIITIKTGL